MKHLNQFKKILYSCKTEEHIKSMYKLAEAPELYNNCNCFESYSVRVRLFGYIKEMEEYLCRKS